MLLLARSMVFRCFFPLKKQISNLDLKIGLPQDINKARKREVSSAINVPFISYSHSYQSGNGLNDMVISPRHIYLYTSNKTWLSHDLRLHNQNLASQAILVWDPKCHRQEQSQKCPCNKHSFITDPANLQWTCVYIYNYIYIYKSPLGSAKISTVLQYNLPTIHQSQNIMQRDWF